MDRMDKEYLLLANELQNLFDLYQSERHWWGKWSIKHVIFVKVKYRLPTIIDALIEAERKKNKNE